MRIAFVRHRLKATTALSLLAITLLACSPNADAVPRKILAVSQTQPSGLADDPNNPSDSILFYDVTEVETPGAMGLLNNEPLFAVWAGFEIFQGEANDEPEGLPFGNREEFSALTFNPANGTIYAAAFDSGSPAFSNPANGQVFNTPDPVGDNQGDFDLYRIDYQAILKDFTDNSRAKGTVYAPKTLTITESDEEFLRDMSGGPSPLFDGVVDGLANDIPHPSGAPTVHLDGAFAKIGELGRAQSPDSFFDYEIDFVDPETLVVLDSNTADTSAGDYQIRQWKRVSTSPGNATISTGGPDGLQGNIGTPEAADDDQGGYNGNSIESWESTILGRLGLDGDTEGTSSDPVGWAFVKRDGVLGVWVADADGSSPIDPEDPEGPSQPNGDDIAFYELDLSSATPTATRKNLGGSSIPSILQLADDPTAGPAGGTGESNNGVVNFLKVDSEGNLVIGESNFFDTPSDEPKVITVGIEDYDDANGEVAPEGFAASGGVDGFDSSTPYSVSATLPISGAIDNDTELTDIRRVAYDKGTGLVYIIDRDFDFVEDLYVFDPSTGEIVYSELTTSVTPYEGPLNPGIINAGTQVVFTRGDITGNGIVDASDIAAITAAIADPTQGGIYSSEVGQEFYDLTGDGLLTNDDLIELQAIIGQVIVAGDFNNDGFVNAADYTTWRDNLGAGDDTSINGAGDGVDGVDENDYAIWLSAYTGASSSLEADGAQAVPEPATALLLLVGGCTLVAWRRN